MRAVVEPDADDLLRVGDRDVERDLPDWDALSGKVPFESAEEVVGEEGADTRICGAGLEHVPGIDHAAAPEYTGATAALGAIGDESHGAQGYSCG